MSIRRVFYALAVSCFALTVATASASIPSTAGSMHPLAAVAHKYGYAYMRRNSENAIELAKTGVDVIFRAGSRLYWVNGEPDSVDIAPIYRQRDYYVSDATVRMLARIARSSAPKRAANADPPQAQPGSGPLTVSAVGGLGTETLNVFGSAPPNAPIRIALYAQLSRDLPTVFLNTASTVASAQGKYAMAVPIGPDYVRNSIITVSVAASGGATASTTYVVGAPSPNVHINSADSIADP